MPRTGSQGAEAGSQQLPPGHQENSPALPRSADSRAVEGKRPPGTETPFPHALRGTSRSLQGPPSHQLAEETHLQGPASAPRSRAKRSGFGAEAVTQRLAHTRPPPRSRALPSVENRTHMHVHARALSLLLLTTTWGSTGSSIKVSIKKKNLSIHTHDRPMRTK